MEFLKATISGKDEKETMVAIPTSAILYLHPLETGKWRVILTKEWNKNICIEFNIENEDYLYVALPVIKSQSEFNFFSIQ